MKKIQTIGITILLATFLLTLLIPATAFAAVCVNTAVNCGVEVEVDCECGTATAKKGDFCKVSKNAVYATKANCEAERRALPPASFRLGTDNEVPTSGDDLLARIQVVSNWVFAIFLAISIIYIVLGAFQFVTGGGDPAKITEARQKIMFAAIGITIALLAAGFPVILRTIVT